jgi:hypothetical protein
MYGDGYLSLAADFLGRQLFGTIRCLDRPNTKIAGRGSHDTSPIGTENIDVPEMLRNNPGKKIRSGDHNRIGVKRFPYLSQVFTHLPARDVPGYGPADCYGGIGS